MEWRSTHWHIRWFANREKGEREGELKGPGHTAPAAGDLPQPAPLAEAKAAVTDPALAVLCWKTNATHIALCAARAREPGAIRAT